METMQDFMIVGYLVVAAIVFLLPLATFVVTGMPG